MVLLFSAESRENPFVANGELSQKADYILTHSTITRRELDIKDPDAQKNGSGDQANEVCTVAKVSTTASAPDSHPADGRPIEVEVAKGSAVPPQPQHAEEVKLKKRKCCTMLWVTPANQIHHCTYLLNVLLSDASSSFRQYSACSWVVTELIGLTYLASVWSLFL